MELYAGLSGVKGRLKRLKNFKILKEALSCLNFKTIKRLLLVISCLLTALLFFDFFRGQLNSKQNLEKILSFSVRPKIEKPLVALLPRKEYLKEAVRRNIFSSFTEKLPVQIKANVDFEAEVKDLKLVGVIWSDNPQAMIESTKGNKTYLLSRGAKINQLSIKRIFRNRVIIGIGDKEWELE